MFFIKSESNFLYIIEFYVILKIILVLYVFFKKLSIFIQILDFKVVTIKLHLFLFFLKYFLIKLL